jgi:hypothetical protein
VKKTAKGRETEITVSVNAAMPEHPVVMWESRLLPQPSPESKSAKNLTRMYEAHGGQFEMGVRVYLQDGSKSIRLFGPLEPHEGMGEGYQGNVRADSNVGLEIMKLLED